jgi:hypothetical protein
MQISRYVPALALIIGTQIFGANFATFDTTVQVKIWYTGLPDSTFIKLRNTGFTLSFSAMSYDGLSCPTKTLEGDFAVRPNSSWDIQSTNSFGDSANFAQTIVTYYCDLGLYFRRVLTPGHKYQQHWWYKGTQSDTIYSRVKTVVNDSTFVLTVSAQDFTLTTALQSKLGNLPKWTLGNDYSPNGRKINSFSKIQIDAQGNKIINLNK